MLLLKLTEAPAAVAETIGDAIDLLSGAKESLDVPAQTASGLSVFMLGLSYFLFACSLAYIGHCLISRIISRSGKPEPTTRRLMKISLLLIVSVWALRFSVGLYSVQKTGLTPLEELFNSFVHALQTFSMDEDYTDYIINGKLMADHLPVGFRGLCCGTFYGVYASFLNVVSPIAGGAIIFDILTSIFPMTTLLRKYAFAWLPRNIYFFSELNDRSVAMAKGLLEKHRKKQENEKRRWHNLFRPVLVFTDAYHSSDEEQETERILEAKQIGGICLKDDIVHLYKNKLFGKDKRVYVLIDENEINNLSTLTEFASSEDHKDLQCAVFCLFCNNEISVGVTDRVREMMENKIRKNMKEVPKIYSSEPYGDENCRSPRKKRVQMRRAMKVFLRQIRKIEKSGASQDKDLARLNIGYNKLIDREIDARMPQITTIRRNQNLIYSLLQDVPLYEPLICEQREESDLIAEGAFAAAKKKAGIASETVPSTMNGQSGEWVRKRKNRLDLTIFGIGELGTEMFLGAFWCGQLPDTILTINVVSKEPETEFFGKIDKINPEILRCGKRLLPERCRRRSMDESYLIKDGDPYFYYSYTRVDLRQADLGKLLDQSLTSDPTESDSRAEFVQLKLGDSDYFVVTLGADEENLSVVERLKAEVSKRHIPLLKKACGSEDGSVAPEKPRTVIAYAIFDSELCETLNTNHSTCSLGHFKTEKGKLQFDENGKPKKEQPVDIYTVAFGDLKTTYSYDNLFMYDIKDEAVERHNAYNSAGKKNHSVPRTDRENESRQIRKNVIDQIKDSYSYRSSAANAIHYFYKMFSSGVIDSSYFLGMKQEERSTEYKNYKTVFNDSILNTDKLIVDSKKGEAESLFERNTFAANQLNFLEQCAWIEHRRWNAYMLAAGFSTTANFRAYYACRRSHKDFDRRLHPCIAPSDRSVRMKAIRDAKGMYVPMTEALVKQKFIVEESDFVDGDGNPTNKTYRVEPIYRNETSPGVVSYTIGQGESGALKSGRTGFGVDALDKVTGHVKAAVDAHNSALKAYNGGNEPSSDFCMGNRKIKPWMRALCEPDKPGLKPPEDFKQYDYPFKNFNVYRFAVMKNEVWEFGDYYYYCFYKRNGECVDKGFKSSFLPDVLKDYAPQQTPTGDEVEQFSTVLDEKIKSVESPDKIRPFENLPPYLGIDIAGLCFIRKSFVDAEAKAFYKNLK